jgi:hypothetical protein
MLLAESAHSTNGRRHEVRSEAGCKSRTTDLVLGQARCAAGLGGAEAIQVGHREGLVGIDGTRLLREFGRRPRGWIEAVRMPPPQF